MTSRMRRVNEAVRAVVAEALVELSDPRIGLVTVTGVSITPDLREGTVYVAVYGNARKRKAALAGLESAHAYLQACIARELTLKRTPHLSFEYDPSVEEGVRMTKLIDELTPGGSSDDVSGDAGNDSSV
jgi:ribosome-binding factor A